MKYDRLCPANRIILQYKTNSDVLILLWFVVEHSKITIIILYSCLQDSDNSTYYKIIRVHLEHIDEAAGIQEWSHQYKNNANWNPINEVDIIMGLLDHFWISI